MICVKTANGADNVTIPTSEYEAMKDEIARLNSVTHYKIYVSIFSATRQLNTDATVPVPAEIGDEYLLVSVKVSNDVNGANVPIESFYDINYVGTLKTNGVYQISNPNCLTNTARAIWVYW